MVMGLITVVGMAGNRVIYLVPIISILFPDVNI